MSSHQQRRVVVTGLGVVSPVGNDVNTAWRNILAGKSGISVIDTFDVSNFSARIAGLVRGFDPQLYGISTKDARKMDTFVQYGIAAAVQAIQDAGLSANPDNASRIGVSIGSGIGGLAFIEKNHDELRDAGPRRISPFFIPGAIINMSAGYVSIMYGFKGPNIAFATACTTGVHSIGMAARCIAYGDADIMVAGGAEKASTPLGVGGFAAARALSTRNDEPEKASRPWDVERDGFVLGDGASVLVLEEYESAKKRGAKIYAELIGFGMSASAFHITSYSEGGLGEAEAMTNALKDARINPDAVNYVNAHGTSTPVGDVGECMAIKVALGEHAKKIPVSSTKSMTGHLLGAAGAIEAMFCVLALRDQIAPPTINLDNPSPDCDLDFVPHHAREMKMDICISNSFGFGGTNGALVFRRV
ncbi:MAG: beta-ketoacyl-[acyl-carrier-protein] synthase II [Gammaproteobacteria bacterium 39-13]|nr:beta-ketoacyl-ACP synthase II [Gammaproteobacteria bacterium]OJV91837.1 MAG: beta-ketoacyl-[acyl-carrier-protein] synthase II [Gammaproteobacteria bacterium 39-13]